MKKVRLPYSNSYLDIEIPVRYSGNILSGKYAPGLKNEKEAILEALENPIGCSALRKLIGRKDKAAVIVTDNTRACPDDRILPVILAMLEETIPRENITIIIALGLHPPLSDEEMRKKLGGDITGRYKVVNHDPAATRYIGETSRGVPVEVNSQVIEADFRISTGFIEPHFFAGFSGGRKSIAPGVSSARSIRHNHSYRMLDHPRARAGVLKNNPVHEDMVEQARMAGLNFIVNVLLDADGGITRVFCGDPVAAHERGCRTAEDMMRVPVENPMDITLTTNGGAPLDLDFYQVCKGIDTAAQITRDGGIIIAAAGCHRGVGPEEFRAVHASAKSPEDVLTKLSRSLTRAEGVSWQNQILARAQLNHQIFLYSTLEDNAVRPMMVTPIHSIQEGLDKAFGALGRDANLAVIPQGPLVLPTLKKGGNDR
jgi:nickel-dependent lactate racemase